MPRFPLSTQELWLLETKLVFVPQDAFAHLLNISHIYISNDNSLEYLERHSFYNLPRVRHIQLTSIKTLDFIDCEAFKNLPNLKYLGIINTGIRTFPELQHIHSFQDDFVLEIVENALVKVMPANALSGISASLIVMLHSNGLREIQRFAFNGSCLEEVYLQRNMYMDQIDKFAFHGVNCGPTHIDISETKVQSLPSIGMEAIEKLQAKNTWTLKVLPPLRTFIHLQHAELTYPSHCCGLKMLKRWRGLAEMTICNLSKSTLTKPRDSSSPLLESYDFDDLQSAHMSNVPVCSDVDYEDKALFHVEFPTESPSEGFNFALCNSVGADTELVCSPVPDLFNPCEDVISQNFLRPLVWVVSLLALSANLLVMLTLLTSQQKLTVTRFLMGQLAFADFCMGVYLLLIASVDIYTQSHYYHYAMVWQNGAGCSLAGTLSVFACELSVYTLTLISIQRWYAIFNAMRLDNKMRLRHAVVLMVIGWALCGTVALLPVVGVSSYQKVSVCLPMDTGSTAARAYVVVVLMMNVTSFLVVCLCYLHIYCMVHNPQHQSSKYDTGMAKRMAILIFTNFLCLVPICFYGLSAALHQPLLTITDSKVLLVLFYPLNSCTHPFFYAILTKGFHQDILMLLNRMGLCQKRAHLYRSQLLHLGNNPTIILQKLKVQESADYKQSVSQSHSFVLS
ncbi:thyrotropin receptor-like isoform X1 [Boleophthalmus pectinirostris]|uniref:thyrotropin receptor-like isoform X1 n=1 Tax=Boleophthalmus pectinirostris TaxID=150288 RepID=UPI00242E0EE7|nr:thyrotropin receptor-like isoform X1 [Boleophthalmus pectinirostris]